MQPLNETQQLQGRSPVRNSEQAPEADAVVGFCLFLRQWSRGLGAAFGIETSMSKKSIIILGIAAVIAVSAVGPIFAVRDAQEEAHNNAIKALQENQQCQDGAIREWTNLQLDTLTAQEVEQVKQKLHLLQEDMSRQQALSTLGLSRHKGRFQSVSGGSGGRGRIVYTLREGHELTLQYLHIGAGSNRVVQASLDGETWRGRDAR